MNLERERARINSLTNEQLRQRANRSEFVHDVSVALTVLGFAAMFGSGNLAARGVITSETYAIITTTAWGVLMLAMTYGMVEAIPKAILYRLEATKRGVKIADGVAYTFGTKLQGLIRRIQTK